MQRRLPPAWNHRHNGYPMHTENYTEIQRVLAEERSLADAAEAHGTLAGCLCAAIGYRFEDWLLEILPEGRAHPMAKETLRELYVDTAGGGGGGGGGGEGVGVRGGGAR